MTYQTPALVLLSAESDVIMSSLDTNVNDELWDMM